MVTPNCTLIVSTSAAAPWLHPLLLILPDCIRFCWYSLITSALATSPDCVCFSCCFSTVSTCYHAHTVQSIVSMKIAHHSLDLPLEHLASVTPTPTHTTKILIEWYVYIGRGWTVTYGRIKCKAADSYYIVYSLLQLLYILLLQHWVLSTWIFELWTLS